MPNSAISAVTFMKSWTGQIQSNPSRIICRTRDQRPRSALKTEEAVQKIRDSLPHQLRTSYARYGSGEANGNSAKCFHIGRLENDAFGHMTRMLWKRLARQVLLATPTGKRPRRRPKERTRWRDYIYYIDMCKSCSQGRTQEFFRGGGQKLRKIFALTKVQATLFTITFM